MMDVIDKIEQLLKTQDREVFVFISDEIKRVFEGIKESKTDDDLNLYFKILEKIQYALSMAVFKDNITVPSNIRNFIRDFERLDDKEMQQYLYKKLKNNQINI